MSILLVRHGETPSNRERVMQLEDTPLSALGMRQAELLAPRLHAAGIAEILCSDLTRARMTAEPLLRTSAAPLTLTPLLRERSFGDLRGTPYSALSCDPFAPDFEPPGGESWPVFYARVAEAFALVCARKRALDARGSASVQNLIVITHGLVLRALIQHHVHWPDEAGERPHFFSNTSVTELSGDAPYAVMQLNCCAHLAAQGANPC
jgi:probable phosphoglycerate mutase